jgi:hypothetical protein
MLKETDTLQQWHGPKIKVKDGVYFMFPKLLPKWFTSHVPKRKRIWIEIMMLVIIIWLMFVAKAHTQETQQRVNQSDETKFALQHQWNGTADNRMNAIEKHLDNTDLDVKELASDMEKIFGGLITLATLAGANIVVQFKRRRES